jgi:DNA-binding CsgD family transcriptional regulator
MVDRGAPHAAAAEFQRASRSPDDWPGFLGATSLEARGRMRLALGDRRRGLEDVLEAGRRISAYGLDNPACFPWRSGAAPALAADGRRAEAVTLAAREVELARRWGAPRALGLALRVQAAVVDDAEALALRHEAVGVLAGSPALLERARALIDLGAALRRAGSRTAARPLLREGLELAHVCGAPHDVARAGSELRAAGGRSRAVPRSGLDALTPSELRVARMAAEGRSNPAIAQALFVTIKTVEMHLSASYRKLDVRSRAELPAHMPT